jgi:hypothetical protein
MSFRVKNLSEVLKGLNLEEKNIELAAKYAIGKVGIAVENQAKRNAKTGVHKPGEPRIAGSGPGPNYVTGNLFRNITSEVRVGFGSYVAVVSSNAEYARAVEFGSSRWKSGVKYPYMVPAVDKLKKDGTLNRVLTQAFRSKMRG